MINKIAVTSAFNKAAYSYDAQAVAQHSIAKRLMAMIAECNIASDAKVLEIGCGTGLLTKEIVHEMSPSHITINDISPQMGEIAKRYIDDKNIDAEFICADAEEYAFEGDEYDLIASSSAMQWFVAPDRFVDQMASKMKRGGVMAISTFRADNLIEITSLSGKGLEYPSVERLREIFEGASLHIEALIEERITLTFATTRDVLAHLRQTGVNNTSATKLSFRQTKQMLDEYERRYKTEEGVTLTYHPIYIICRK